MNIIIASPPPSRKYIRLLCALYVALIVGLTGATVWAQSPVEAAITPPSFSADFLAEQKALLGDNTTLTAEQITNASENYDNARAALQTAAAKLEIAERLQLEFETTPITLERLREQLSDAQPDEGTTTDEPEELVTGATLLKLRQELVTKEGDLRNLRAEITNHETELQNLLTRPVREELAEARNRLAEISTQLADMPGFGDLETLARSRRYLLEARQYSRQTEIQALELELSGMSGRQQTLNLRRDLAQLRAQQVEQEVITLQTRTGQRRLTQALKIESDALSMLAVLENSHPYLINYAAENLTISQKLTTIAAEASASPQAQANARSRSDAIKNDLDIARQLTDLENINRQSSSTLRRLRAQRPSTKAVRSEIASTRNAIIVATQDRLWAQERLREFPTGLPNASTAVKDWNTDQNGPLLHPNEVNQLQALMVSRRNLLLQLSDAAFSTIADADELETLQTELLGHTDALQALLDQKLLWLPSVASVNAQWPQKVLRGAFKVFSMENITSAVTVLSEQLQRYLLMVLVFIIVIITIILFRRRLRMEIARTAKKVGRVQKDSYWHTPNVILSCAIIAAPIPLTLMLFGILFQSSPDVDPVIQAYGQTGIELSGFALFFLTWREWNREHSLLDAHYNLPTDIRRRVSRQLDWFIPFAGITIALVTVTQDSRESDVYEGFSLLAFMVTAGALAFFSGKIIWAKREAFKSALNEESALWRYRQLITFILVGLPVLAALLAAAGYYDTARELLSRLFFSGGLMMGTYVTYGLIRRTVLIAQRRLALRQAIERREKSAKARAEKEAAEERGDPPPPPVNYEDIDLETLSRQSAQLLNTFMVLGFALLMWVFWQDLLPALSIFDNVTLWPHSVSDGSGGTKIENVSLWNLTQALAIVIITFLAAKNLPGFLEVFILNRSRFDAGTRYAIVSVVGYSIIAVGIVAAFNKLGTDWSQMQWVVAALGVGIGFGLQEIIANFISGLIILFERPVRIGDYVTIGDQSGTVTRIKIRATTLSDLDNREILIPNKELITGRVTNWTLSNSETRMIIKVGVAYGSDTNKVRELMLNAVLANPKVLEKPNPQVFFLGFGDSSLDFEIRVFLRSFEDRFPVSHMIHTDIYAALGEAGISIPFPQRDLHIVTMPGQA